MIICSCALITSDDIDRAVEWMRASDPTVRVTPGKIYRALGKQPDCGSCLERMIEQVCRHMTKADETAAPGDALPIPMLRAI